MNEQLIKSTSSEFPPYVEFKDLPDTTTPVDATNLNALQSLMRQDIQDNQSVPSGGTTGQVLKKTSDTDYDIEWANETSQVVDNLDGNSTTLAPSQNAVSNAISSISEVVTNGKGTAIKYSNGQMICHGKFVGTSEPLVGYFEQFKRTTENIKVTFPVQFVTEPVINITPFYNTYIFSVMINTIGTTNFGFTGLKANNVPSSNTGIAFEYVAIGTWK